MLITKVLQALANNVRFGIKEPGLRALNDFCDTQIFGMTRFLQAVSVSRLFVPLQHSLTRRYVALRPCRRFGAGI